MVSLLHKSCTTRLLAELVTHGENNLHPSNLRQKAKAILPSPHNHGQNRPTPPRHPTTTRTLQLGRMTKWCIMLTAYDIQHEPRQTIKAQAHADFIEELTIYLKEQGPIKLPPPKPTPPKQNMYVDEPSRNEHPSEGIYLQGPYEMKIEL